MFAPRVHRDRCATCGQLGENADDDCIGNRGWSCERHGEGPSKLTNPTQKQDTGPCGVAPRKIRRSQHARFTVSTRSLAALQVDSSPCHSLPARQPAMPVIGFVHLTSLEETRENLAAFRRGLDGAGYIEGRNVAIEYRWEQGRNDRLPMLLAELVRRHVSTLRLESDITQSER